jgi:short-subunit dehydrogenase
MKVQAVEADISTTTEPYVLTDAAASKFGKIGILVNNVSLAFLWGSRRSKTGIA